MNGNSQKGAVATVAPASHTTLQEYEGMKAQATDLIKTGFLPKHIRTAEQAVAVALMGRELNIPMMQAFRKVYVVNGTPCVAAEMMLALARRTGEVQDVTTKDNGSIAKVTITRKGQTPHEELFSMDDAKRMGLTGKDNWRKMPKIMRRWRAVAAAVRFVFGDAVGGLYTLEEVAPDVVVDEQGDLAGPMPRASRIVDMPTRQSESPDEPPTEAPPTQDSAPEPTPDGGDSPPEEAPQEGAAPEDLFDDDGRIVVEIDGKKYRTKGVGARTLIEVWGATRTLDGLKEKGTAKTLLKEKFNLETTLDLDEDEGSNYLDWLNHVIEETKLENKNAAKKRGAKRKGGAK